ncbi:Protein of unknown function DUF616 [Dillenia turbinata]|uniref:TOD1/MUCI70 glycosyltransferase-like domain-containing protein n=1 Tax=Dillenia turbinata TaxID=194707 RepID=A0AAN8UMA9_9MAGN
MVVDEVSFSFIKDNVTVREDHNGGQWVGIWRLILLKDPPYDEPRRNGKSSKDLNPQIIPSSTRGKHTFAIAQHKHHHSIYEEADACKRRKRYARPLIDLHMKIYRYEGMEPWNVPEGAVIVREHTAMSNLFSCLWFNEVNLFTPRDQLSFASCVQARRFI